MTLLDSTTDIGKIVRIDGDDAVRTRLVDMGLIGARYKIRIKKSGAILVDFFGESWRFSAVVDQRVAKRLFVVEGTV